MQNPHDRLFRYVFSKPEHALGELRALTPADLRERIDWTTLQQEPGTQVDEALSDLRSDVLFSAKLGGREVLLYLLLEHQSTAHSHMPLKLLGYMVRIWEEYLSRHPNAAQLPAILPFVMHHSEHGWTTAVTLGEILDLEPALLSELGPFTPDFTFLLQDLTAAQDEELRHRSTALAQLAVLCLGRSRSGDLVGELEERLGLCRQVLEAPSGVAALGAVLRYVSEVSEDPPERVRNLARQLGTRGEEAFMTGAQMLRAEGEAKGRAEGEAIGQAKGKAETLLTQIEQKFGKPSEATIERVESAKLEELNRWVVRILTATTLDDVFAS